MENSPVCVIFILLHGYILISVGNSRLFTFWKWVTVKLLVI